MSDAAATPASPAATSPYVFTPELQVLLPIAGLTEAEGIEAFERRDDAMVVPTVPAVLYAIRWLDTGDAIFTSGEFTRMEWRVDRSVPATITLRVALRLRPDLPAGKIDRQMPLDVIWSRIAESFGVPLTCHKNTASFARYTGRWDGKPPRYVAAEGDTIILDGGFERSKDSVKYVWALSVNKYRAWLDGSGTPASDGGLALTAADDGRESLSRMGAPDLKSSHQSSSLEPQSSSPPRVVFARMCPAKLTRHIVVRADIGEATVRLLCSRASFVDVDDPPFFHPRMKCLHVFGAEILEGDEIPRQLSGKEYIIPIHFITDLRPGPSVFLADENTAPRAAVLPNGYKPGNRMSLKMIEIQLNEWTAKA